MSTRRPSARTSAVIFVGVLAGALLSQTPVSAHTGHEVSGFGPGLLHPIAGPDHLLAMVAIGIVAVVAGTRRMSLLVPAGFLFGMTIGAVLAMNSITFGAIEIFVSLSVIASGVLCIARLRRNTLALPLAAAVLGLAHGQAHGAEVPLGAVPVSYLLGFLVTTAALHLVGAFAGLSIRHSDRIRMLVAAIVSGAGLAVLLGV